MVSYLGSAKNHAFDIPYIDSRLCSKLFAPSWVYIDPYLKTGVDKAYINILNKVSMLWELSPISYCGNTFNNIPSMEWVSHKKSSVPTSNIIVFVPNMWRTSVTVDVMNWWLMIVGIEQVIDSTMLGMPPLQFMLI